MKAMIMSELLLWRQSNLKYSLIFLGFGVLFGVLYDNAVMTLAMVFCMFGMSYVMGGPANDEVNDWQVGRLCLALNRRQVVAGRYASLVVFSLYALVVSLVGLGIVYGVSCLVPGVEVLAGDDVSMLGQAAMVAAALCFLLAAVMAGILYPLTFKMGNTKAARVVPVILVMLFLVGGLYFGSDAMAGEAVIGALNAFVEANLGLVSLAAVVVGVVVLLISYVISQALYAKREF